MWILAFLVPKPVISHAWWLHFDILGNLGAILGHLGAQERLLPGPASDFYLFLVDLGTPLRELLKYIGPQNMCFIMLVSRRLFLIIFGSESGCPGLEN